MSAEELAVDGFKDGGWLLEDFSEDGDNERMGVRRSSILHGHCAVSDMTVDQAQAPNQLAEGQQHQATMLLTDRHFGCLRHSPSR